MLLGALKRNAKTNLKPAHLFLSTLDAQVSNENRSRDLRSTTADTVLCKDAYKKPTLPSSNIDIASSHQNLRETPPGLTSEAHSSSRYSRKDKPSDYSSRSDKENSRPKPSSSRLPEESSSSVDRHRAISQTPLQSQGRFNQRHDHRYEHREQSPDVKDLERGKRKAEYQLESEREKRQFSVANR